MGNDSYMSMNNIRRVYGSSLQDAFKFFVQLHNLGPIGMYKTKKSMFALHKANECRLGTPEISNRVGEGPQGST